MDWKLFFSTFCLIFVAELPDKTAFATLLMATRGKPLPIFIGAALAFVIQTLVAVLFGTLFGKLPQRWVHLATGLLFLVFAFLAWRQIEKPGEETQNESTEKKSLNTKSNLLMIWSSFLVIFVAEWGDLTQLASASLIAKYNAPLTIFVASVLALWAVTALAIVAGNRLKNLIRAALLQKIAAIAFLVVGSYFLWSWARG